MPIHISNLSYFDSSTNKAIKIGFKIEKEKKLESIKVQARNKIMSRLLEEYRNNISPGLKTKLGLANTHQVPKILKIILNMGIGEGKEDSKLIDKAVEDLTLISGQKAIKTKAKKAISGFKIRQVCH